MFSSLESAQSSGSSFPERHFPSASPLGKPIPPLPHAVSVSMPAWADVVGYEDGDARVHSALTTGYPRFVLHPFVRALISVARQRFAADGESLLVFPSQRSAQRAAEYVGTKSGAPARICDLDHDGLHAVVTGAAGEVLLREYWQHSGEIVSSRRAQSALEGGRESLLGAAAKEVLRAKLAEWYDCFPRDTVLFPSGAAAVAQAQRLCAARGHGLRSIQLGYPYLDTLRAQERLGGGYVFVPVGNGDEFEQLAALVEREEFSAVFTEVPANPLLRTADLSRIAPLLNRAGVPLVVDDTLGTPFNVNVSPYADIVVSSLTKFASGKGNVIAGSLVIPGRNSLAAELRGLLKSDYEDLLWNEDAVVLENNARGFRDRVERSCATAREAACALLNHPLVERVYYPEYQTSSAYEALRRPDGGYGAVLSVVVKDGALRAPPFYDALECAKGPGLGNEFTLACPYTLLTHFKELEWAEARDVSRWLVRISVGTEDPAWVCGMLLRALEIARDA